MATATFGTISFRPDIESGMVPGVERTDTSPPQYACRAIIDTEAAYADLVAALGAATFIKPLGQVKWAARVQAGAFDTLTIFTSGQGAAATTEVYDKAVLTKIGPLGSAQRSGLYRVNLTFQIAELPE